MPTETKELETLDATRDEKELALAVGRAESLLGKSYLSVLGGAEVTVVPDRATLDTEAYARKLNAHVRLFNITQLVLDKSENMRDKLATVFQSVHAAGASFLMLVTGKKESVTIHVGVRHDGDSDDLVLSQDVLESCLKANFPGATFVRADEKSIGALASYTFACKPRVASVTDIPGLRFEDETKDRRFMQGMEKLIDAMRGEEYSFLVIAEPISHVDLAASRRSLENLYSSLVPFGESQFTAGTNETDSISKSMTSNLMTFSLPFS